MSSQRLESWAPNALAFAVVWSTVMAFALAMWAFWPVMFG